MGWQKLILMSILYILIYIISYISSFLDNVIFHNCSTCNCNYPAQASFDITCNQLAEVVLANTLKSWHSVPEWGFDGRKTYQAPAHIWDLPRWWKWLYLILKRIYIKLMDLQQDFHYLGRSQMCAGAWYVFSPSKLHSGTLCL